MLFLCLAILSSSLVSIVMRLSGSRVQHDLGMLTMNYIVCALLAGAFGGFQGAFDLSDSRIGATLALGTVNGVLYLVSFMLMQRNTRKNGVVLTSIFQKLGLLATMVISVVFYGEIPELLQTIGFLLAIAAIILMNYQKGSAGAGAGGSLVLMLLCFMCMTVTGQKIGKWENLFGILIAVPNYFASKFLLGALERLAAVIVYPVFSVGSILVVTLTGVLAFRERLGKRQWIGMAAILVALVLLNI